MQQSFLGLQPLTRVVTSAWSWARVRIHGFFNHFYEPQGLWTNMTAPIGRHSDNILCEVCSSIDFERLAVSAQSCNKLHRGDDSVTVADMDLGTIEDISQRQNRCNFCALITKHSTGLVGRCKITYRLDFCVSSNQDDFTWDGPHTHTKITQVQLYPNDEVLLWAPAPWEIESHEKHTQGVRSLFDLQAAPCRRHDSFLIDHTSITGRRVLPSIDTALLKSWLSICEHGHAGRCPHSATTPTWETDFMPAFVIDIEDSRVVETPPNCRYVALSYVWGTANVLKHVDANSEALRRPGSLLEMDVPTTIGDAMTLVKAIGERFLWVDALCIVQDRPAMQQAQIAKMDRVYAKALFTIVAASGDNSYVGLPGVGQTPRVHAQDILRLPNRDLYVVICDYTEFGNVLKRATWAHRAWTMQEQLCSGRCLIFTETQVYWKCNCATWLEELALEGTGSTNLEIFHLGGSFRFPTHALNKYEYFRLYRNMLKYYLQRRLSFQSDRINAFSGICSRLSVIQDDVFIWGLPQSQFSRSLGWEFVRGQHAKHSAYAKLVSSKGVLHEIPFPSWSWAAWDNGGITHQSSTWHGEISFRQSSESEQPWNRSGNEFHPVVDFWICDESGTLVPIDEPGTHGRWLDTYDTDHRFAWQGTQRDLPEVIRKLNADAKLRQPGLLHFWTSVVSLTPEELDTYGYQLLPSFETRCMELDDITLKGRGDMGPGRTLDFFVVARTDELMAEIPIKHLLVLIVQWKDGIAYSLGSSLVSERKWLALEQREWKFVVLG
jgi:hypothetical protein